MGNLSRKHYWITLALMVFVPIVMLGYFLLYETLKKEREDKVLKSKEITRLMAENIGEYLFNNKVYLRQIANEAGGNVSEDRIRQLFRFVAKAQPQISLIYLADLQGNFRIVYPYEDVRVEYREAEFFQRASKGEEHVSTIIKSKVTGGQVITVALPVLGEDGKVIGVLGASTPLLFLEREIKNLQTHDTDIAFIVDERGRAITELPESLRDIDFRKIPSEINKDFIVQRASVPGSQWQIFVLDPLVELEATLMNLATKNISVIILAGLSILWGFLFYQSEQRLKEEKNMQEAAKLSLVGQMAAGMAHEIRNPLTTIKGFVQLLKFQDKDLEFKELILEEINRIEEIIKETLLLAKPQAINMRKVDLKQVLSESIALMEPYARFGDVVIEVNFRGNDFGLYGEGNHLKQAFVNLFKNSIEAMPYGGEMTVDMEGQNEEIVIRIKDQGKGMSKEVINNLGRPFFSTKEDGYGLGMMVTKRILTNHQGRMEVQSEPQKGTTFLITLPKGLP